MFCTISPWLATSSASSMAGDCDQEMTLECKNILQNATNRKYKKCLIFILLFYHLWFVQCLDWLQGKCRRSALVLCKFNMGHLIDSLAFFILVLNEGRRGGGSWKNHTVYEKDVYVQTGKEVQISSLWQIANSITRQIWGQLYCEPNSTLMSEFNGWEEASRKFE